MNSVSYYHDYDYKYIQLDLLNMSSDYYKYILQISNFIVSKESIDIISKCHNLKCIRVDIDMKENNMALYTNYIKDFPLSLLSRPYLEIILYDGGFMYSASQHESNIYYAYNNTLKVYYNNSPLLCSHDIKHLTVVTPSDDEWYNFENLPKGLITLITHTNVAWYDNLPIALKKFTGLYDTMIKAPYKCKISYYRFSQKIVT